MGFNRIVYIICDALTLRTIAEVRGGMAVLENYTLMFDASTHFSIKK
jgi:hypothetical protein